MKTFTRWLLALLLVAAPAIAVVHTASANTEMVPGSRLVAPYITIETGRSTFLLLTNASARRYTAADGSTSDLTVGGVHIEFYDKACTRNSRTVQLSPKDIDQINADSTFATALATSSIGFADIDIRNTTVYTDPTTAPSIRGNVLMGVTLVADNTNDFAFSYPMASSLGSAASGSAGGTIVTRSASLPTAWSGRYEPYPSRVFVPIFYAEGTDSQGATVTAFLSVVSPPDGNWHGGGSLTTGNQAEAPGQALQTDNINPLLSIDVVIYDGCEHHANDLKTGHTLMGTLTSLFTAGVANRSTWTAANCTAGNFPGLDELSSQPLGWIQLTNTSRQCRATLGGCGVGSTPVTGTTATRGLVGVLFESSVGGSPSKKMADNSRLWGDPSTREESTSSGTTCKVNATTSVACQYTNFSTNRVIGSDL